MPEKQNRNVTNRAKTLRKKMSLPEVLVWQRLRPKVNKEFNLRRQTPLLDRFVVDFYYDPKRIAFEIDGRMFHEDQVDYDFERDRLLAKNGITVVRIGAYRVLNDPYEVSNFIRMICTGQISLDDLERGSYYDGS